MATLADAAAADDDTDTFGYATQALADLGGLDSLRQLDDLAAHHPHAARALRRLADGVAAGCATEAVLARVPDGVAGAAAAFAVLAADREA